MDELKCKECGAELQQGVKECPSCGCPVEEVKVERKEQVALVPKAKKTIPFNIMSIVALLLGIVIIVMGVKVMNTEISIDTYNAKHYDADYAAFGGDFYTEIYGASDIIVDELDDINSGVETLSESMGDMVNAIYYPIGMMIIALGLGVVAVSIIHIKKERV